MAAAAADCSNSSDETGSREAVGAGPHSSIRGETLRSDVVDNWAEQRGDREQEGSRAMNWVRVGCTGPGGCGGGLDGGRPPVVVVVVVVGGPKRNTP